MLHIILLCIAVLVFALCAMSTWRRYRRSPRTRQDWRRFIATNVTLWLLLIVFVATHYIHGDQLPGWVSYLGDLALVLAIVGIGCLDTWAKQEG